MTSRSGGPVSIPGENGKPPCRRRVQTSRRAASLKVTRRTVTGNTFGNIAIDTNVNTVTFAGIGTPAAALLLDYQIDDGHGGTAVGHVTVTPEIVGSGGGAADNVNLSAVTDLFAVSYIDAG